MRQTILLICLLISVQNIFSQSPKNPLLTKDVEQQEHWVDSLYNEMTLQEKIGQLFMVRAFSNKGQAHENSVLKLIENNHIGGIIYSTGGPVAQAKLNNKLQSKSKVPLLIGMDAEWGLSMRLDSTYAFPWNMTLGAIKDNALVEQTGRQLGEHCKRIGVHFNFAPVVDINTNPLNPIIGNRSFGEDKDNVTQKALAFMKGMQSAGVLATAKHFPGHGDTDQDSHKTLPTVNFDKKRIEEVELYPYRELIKYGLSSVMVAHLNIPSLESRSGYPSSISRKIVTDLLKDKMQFQGLIYTDALEMKGAANFSEPGDIDLAAFLAGNDVLLISEDVPKAMFKIEEAFNDGRISEDRLAYSVKKILQAKYKVGLNNFEPIVIDHLVEDLNRIKDDALNEALFEEAITVVKNEDNILPLRDLDKRSIAYVHMGDDSGSTFLKELKKYTKVHEIKGNMLDDNLTQLEQYNTVIIGLHRSNKNPWKSYKFTDQELVWLYEIARKNDVILDVFVKPYALLDLSTTKNIESIVVSYQNSDVAQEKSAQIIFGALSAKGQLPVSIGDFPQGTSITLGTLKRLGYSIPEREGMSSELLKKVDSVAEYAVKKKMTPGIQLLIARHGKVIYNKSFGTHAYDPEEPVKFNDIYDLASLTKILSTLPMLMEMVDQNIVSLDTKLSEILPEYKSSNKAKITLKEMLSHYARLKPWIPFYMATMDSVTKHPSPNYYSTTYDKNFNVKVANNMYMRADYQDSIQKIIRDSDLLSKLRYRYSDLPYYILKEYIEHYYDKPLDELVHEHFYASLGANYTMYNPSTTFSNKNIVPTEKDGYYRFQKVQGYVHDMGAAMQNGVGGHAGVFSNANDVAKIMQMYLQKGYYGGKQYFKPETLDKFNRCYYCQDDNRRGVGFDKPQLGDVGPTCGCLSMTSFGHSGFTGTYAWADPEEEIVYVFLANRTYPDSADNTLLKEDIRTNIQKLIYESIID
ncbi:glycoside hydrolase family 3 N-terminal domain-containing protein [Mangrovimonas aestuarii]|uniref:glycoside hydrolase family 3 N-terminal domain-containing protein n=1 Tax=Mangrovimonas aestuarii TaxID=3018443 RepID=UPI002378A047|nr:glycoside hydrolase family 3 N-terminal domain-containing protein [Mangrovimonas aestuarii]